MGIRFACHGCHKPLNIKNELAGRRGVCPQCQTRFRIPHEDAEFSSPVAAQVKLAEASAHHDSRADVPERPVTNELASGSAEMAGGVATLSEPTTAPSPVRTIEILDGDPDATWYVRPPSGGQYGPAKGDVLKGWIDEGRVACDALLWRDGWPQWRDASEVLADIASTLPGGSRLKPSVPGGALDLDSDLPGAHREPLSLDTESTRQRESSRSTSPIGASSIGATRRARTSKRIMMVAVLGAIVIGLLVTLVIVATRGS